MRLFFLFLFSYGKGRYGKKKKMPFELNPTYRWRTREGWVPYLDIYRAQGT